MTTDSERITDLENQVREMSTLIQETRRFLSDRYMISDISIWMKDPVQENPVDEWFPSSKEQRNDD